MFITFEGIDGSGKSTQITHLTNHLEAKGAEVRVFRDPGGPEVSEKVREILLNPDYSVDPITELLLFSAARSQLVSEKVLPALQEGAVVILDRFYDSTTAYQGYGRSSMPLTEIEYINRIASHKRTPDLTIYMKVPLEEAKKRMAETYKDRMEQAGDTFFNRVIEGFDRMADKEERFFTVDATKPPQQVQQLIWRQVQTLFPARP
ncbi:dTMP kinase [Fodinibius sediminis]|uniref:Thymidylate kinase n=1 Tax=Fodinibius sediminis TaxID=1214077 RepID=A0A521B2C6_9BACT|nr:dTMP kinase [Fodinibius sediminis]SMO41237.1 thymidylate kinase [Fodinibius sediminis]